jgi:tetratricopeptide (TPR) repeat protein
VRRLGASRFSSAAALLLFSVHPIHVEAIANIVGRAEILAALFTFLALWLTTMTGEWRVGGRIISPAPAVTRLASWGAAAALFLALGSKEVALAAPLLMMALEILLRPRRPGQGVAWWLDRAAALAPMALAMLAYLIMRVRALELLFSLQPTHPSDNPLLLMEGVERAATALGLIARYVALLLYPIGLSADYSGPVISAEQGLLAFRPLFGTLILLGCIACLLYAARSPLRAFASLLFLCPYLVVGNLLFDVGTIFAERLMYMPSAGFCLMLSLLLGAAGMGANDRPELFSRSLASAALFVLVAGLAVACWARCLDWRDDESLFLAAMRAQPDSPRASFIVGKRLRERGERQRALELFERSIELFPEHARAMTEKGTLLGERGELERAERSFAEALTIDPAYGLAHYNRGVALRHLGRLRPAERALLKAVLWEPDMAKAWAELGDLYLQTERYPEAEQAYRRGIEFGRADLLPRLLRAEKAEELIP